MIPRLESLRGEPSGRPLQSPQDGLLLVFGARVLLQDLHDTAQHLTAEDRNDLTVAIRQLRDAVELLRHRTAVDPRRRGSRVAIGPVTIARIRELYQRGISITELSRRFHMGHAFVSRIVAGHPRKRSQP